MRKFFSIALVTFVGCASSAPESLTSAELADILDIHAWHVLPEPAGKEWTIDVVPGVVKTGSTHLAKGTALISLRQLPNEEYAFVLSHREGRSSGTFRPCAEPDGTTPICDGYGVEFKDPPVCIGDCSQALVAVLKPMVGTGNERAIVLKLEPSLSIRPDSKTKVIPVP